MVYGSDNPAVVEIDDIDLLVNHIRIEEGQLLGTAADIVPVLVVEDAGARRGAENLDDLVLRRRARPNRGELVRVGKVAALVDGWRTSAKPRDDNPGRYDPCCELEAKAEHDVEPISFR